MVWTEVDGPALERGGIMFGLTGVSSVDVWAVGRSDDIPTTTLVEHWDGSEWTVVPSPSPGQRYSGSSLRAVGAASSTDVWTVGSRSSRGLILTLAEHWDGSNWTMIKTPNPAGYDTVELLGVTSMSADNVWAAGYAANLGGESITLIEHWDGTRWSIVTSPNAPGPSNVLEAISAGSSSEAWAVGDYEDFSGNYRTLTEHWDGSMWKIIPAPSPGGTGFLYGVSDLPTGTAWAAGVGANGPTGMLWDGTRWTAHPGEMPGDLSNQFFAVSALSDRSVWAVGDWSNSEGPIHTLAEYLC